MAWNDQSDRVEWSGLGFGFSVPVAEPFSGLRQWTIKQETAPISSLFQVQGYSNPPTLTDQDAIVVREGRVAAEYHYGEKRPTGFDFKVNDVTEQADQLQFQWCFSANTSLLDESLNLNLCSTIHASSVQLVPLNQRGLVISSEQLPSGSFSLDRQGLAEFVLRSSNDLKGSSDIQAPLIGRQIADCWALLIGLKNCPYHLILAGFPGDVKGLSVKKEGSDEIEIGHQLNFGFLEKGVIRRARFLAAILPTQAAMSVAIESVTEPFYRSGLPLEV